MSNLAIFLQRVARRTTRAPASDETDRRLVEQFLAHRDERAFEGIVRRHGAMVYGVCWRILQRRDDTEDAVQATFVLLAQKLCTLRRQESLGSWLHGIARRVALKARQRADRRRRHEQRAVMTASVVDEVDGGELYAVLDEELARLSEKWRRPLILCYLEGRTQDEAAGQLGWSKNTLRRRLDEARAALGRRLKRRGVVWAAAFSSALIADCTSAAAPPGPLDRIAETALQVARAPDSLVGIVAPDIIALTEGVLPSMVRTKIPIIAVVLCLIVVAGVGAGVAWPTVAAIEGDLTPAVDFPRNPAPAPEQPKKDDATAKELKKLKGVWKVVELEADGKKAPANEIEGMRWTIDDKEILAKDPGEPGKKVSFTIDPSKSPKEIDLEPLEGTEKGKKLGGIYELDGDKLKVCVGDKVRPTDFKTDAKGLGLIAFERVKEQQPGAEGRHDEGAANELKKLQGVWKVVEVEANGEKAPANDIEGVRWTIDAKEILAKEPGDTDRKTAFTIDPSKSPKEIDLETLDGPDKGIKLEGIYELNGDMLKVCIGASARPTKFKVDARGIGLITLERIKGEQPQPERKPADDDGAAAVLFKECKNAAALPRELKKTYAALVTAIGKQRDVGAFCLPQAVTSTREPRAEIETEDGDLNWPFLKSGFSAQVVSAEKQGDDVFRVQTATTALWFVETKSGAWRIFRCQHKPIE